ncbi:TetR/AcrR family transcriptional regulator [Streptomyces flaveolus]|uniref:TetR/AcrR family transcriptional regulator n=1 Tax=Streptomyces flaveolus TaxID=67297 RepID=UPI00382217E0
MEIAEEAAALFLEAGVADTSVRDIAAAAGVSTRTFWHYCTSKEESVLPLFAKVMGGVADYFEQRPADETLLEALGRAATHNAEEAEDAKVLVRLVRLTADEPGLRRVWLQANNEAEGRLTTAIARRYGGAPDSPAVRLQAAMASAAIRVTAEDYARESGSLDSPSPSALERALDVVARGLAGR